MSTQTHWESVCHAKSAEQVSRRQERAGCSLQFIRNTGVAKDGHIIDVGGGVSTLVDDLLRESDGNLTVLDISAVALQAAQERLGKEAHPTPSGAEQKFIYCYGRR